MAGTHRCREDAHCRRPNIVQSYLTRVRVRGSEVDHVSVALPWGRARWRSCRVRSHGVCWSRVHVAAMRSRRSVSPYCGTSCCQWRPCRVFRSVGSSAWLPRTTTTIRAPLPTVTPATSSPLAPSGCSSSRCEHLPGHGTFWRVALGEGGRYWLRSSQGAAVVSGVSAVAVRCSEPRRLGTAVSAAIRVHQPRARQHHAQWVGVASSPGRRC